MTTSPKQKTAAVFAVNLVPHWVHGASPEAKAAIADVMSGEFVRLMEREGVHAFEMPRSAACAHEAGHAIVETILGARVKSVQIYICPRLSRLGIVHAWGGLTNFHGNTSWCIAEDTPTIEIRRHIYRIIAGLAGEFVLDPGNVRSGSSLDERVVGQLLAANLHWREERNGHPSKTWAACWNWVRSVIEHNENIGRDLCRKLDAVKCVKGKPLDAILRQVQSLS